MKTTAQGLVVPDHVETDIDRAKKSAKQRQKEQGPNRAQRRETARELPRLLDEDRAQRMARLENERLARVRIRRAAKRKRGAATKRAQR